MSRDLSSTRLSLVQLRLERMMLSKTCLLYLLTLDAIPLSLSLGLVPFFKDVVGWGYFLPPFFLFLSSYLDICYTLKVYMYRNGNQIKRYLSSFLLSTSTCVLSQNRCVRNMELVYRHMHRDLKLRSNTYSR